MFVPRKNDTTPKTQRKPVSKNYSLLFGRYRTLISIHQSPPMSMWKWAWNADLQQRPSVYAKMYQPAIYSVPTVGNYLSFGSPSVPVMIAPYKIKLIQKNANHIKRSTVFLPSGLVPIQRKSVQLQSRSNTAGSRCRHRHRLRFQKQ